MKFFLFLFFFALTACQDYNFNSSDRDGCVLYGSGAVKNNDQALVTNYQQSNIPAYGLKAGPGAIGIGKEF